MDMARSLLIDTDSYKVSMWKQYPAGTENVFSYVVSRGGVYDSTVFAGVQAFIKERLQTPITQEEINFADTFWTAHGEPFNRDGWQYILDEYAGFLPVKISTLDEGKVYPVGTVLATMVNLDKKVPWLTTWLETPFLRSAWYMTTVATQSWSIKQVIREYLVKSGDTSGLPFKLHDFGSRGVSSLESAMLGGMGHLINFMGTDTAVSIIGANRYYDAAMYSTAFSIPASEHSTITSWGRDNEALAYENMVRQFSKEGSVYAVVSDSYNIYEAMKMWGDLKDLIVATKGTLVIRPDSGDPIVVLPRLLQALEKYFGCTINSKGYKVLNNVRLIWGDGINENSIRAILRMCVDMQGYSADNLAFGMGGALLQIVNRDTQKFAMKCSAIYINGEWRDVYKDPVDDPGKTSLKGLLNVYLENGKYVNDRDRGNDRGLLKARYAGYLIEKAMQDFEELRANSNL